MKFLPEMQARIDEIAAKTDPTSHDMAMLGWLNEIKLGKPNAKAAIFITLTEFGINVRTINYEYGTEEEHAAPNTKSGIAEATIKARSILGL